MTGVGFGLDIISGFVLDVRFCMWGFEKSCGIAHLPCKRHNHYTGELCIQFYCRIYLDVLVHVSPQSSSMLPLPVPYSWSPPQGDGTLYSCWTLLWQRRCVQVHVHSCWCPVLFPATQCSCEAGPSRSMPHSTDSGSLQSECTWIDIRNSLVLDPKLIEVRNDKDFKLIWRAN